MSRELKLIVLLFWTGQITLILFGQEKYWVHKKDTSLLAGYQPNFCAEWLPYCSYTLSSPAVPELNKDLRSPLPVVSFKPNKKSNHLKYGFALEQIEGNLLFDKGLTGKNIKIGIIDGGFLNADQNLSLSGHFREGRVISYTDYITPELPPYEGSKHLEDSHGTEVWTLIGGYNPETEVRSGIASEALYHLARTDHGAFEKRLEEDLLINALEEMHKKGIRIVNISLGYADGYTRKDENYLPMHMDGKTTMLARAIDSAFFSKNMLVIVSAGNEGDRESWEVLSTPADAQGALTVGASVLNGRSRMKFSSIGTPGIGYTKPEIVCFASNGTSFSAPVITGLAAAILQYDTTLTAREMKELIIKSASLYPYGNNHLGFGVPKVSVLLSLLAGKDVSNNALTISTNRKSFRVKGINSSKQVFWFHKNHLNEVIKSDSKRIKRGSLKVKPTPATRSTSILTGEGNYEIDWDNR